MVRGSASHHSSPGYLLACRYPRAQEVFPADLSVSLIRAHQRAFAERAPAEHPRPSREEDSRRVHLESSSLSSGGTLPSFSGLTTSLMALMLPSATSILTTLWGLPSPK